MANRRGMKLFAVAVLASASSAQAGTTTQSTQAARTSTSAKSGIDWAGYVDGTIKPRRLANGSAAPGNTGGGKSKGGGGDDDIAMEDAEPAVAKRVGVDWKGTIEITAIQPRVLADGRPAAGNVSKPLPTQVREEIDHTREALLTASLAYQAVQKEAVIQPRLLASYRPACGNTGGKSDAPADCTKAEIRAVEAYNKASAAAYDKHNAKVQVAYGKLMVATAAAVRIDPMLKTRLLLNGRPACGNTMSKQSPPAFCRTEVEQ